MISKLSDVQSKHIGEGTRIWQYCVILKDAVIGKNCNINFNVFIENDVVVGDEVTIKPGVYLFDGSRIGNKVFIGANVSFINDLAPRSRNKPVRYLPIYIEEGVSIGANSTILANVIIGKYALIGAGSVVTKQIHPFTLWFGNPAEKKGYVTREGIVLSNDLKDKNGIKYQLVEQEPIRCE